MAFAITAKQIFLGQFESIVKHDLEKIENTDKIEFLPKILRNRTQHQNQTNQNDEQTAKNEPSKKYERTKEPNSLYCRRLGQKIGTEDIRAPLLRQIAENVEKCDSEEFQHR